MRTLHSLAKLRISGILISPLCGQVQTPSLTPAVGDSFAIFPLTITCATPSAVIHYTLNNAEPTLTDPVIASGGTITINRNWTFKGQGVARGFRQHHRHWRFPPDRGHFSRSKP